MLSFLGSIGSNLLGSVGDKLIGGLFDSDYDERLAQTNRQIDYERQKEFAQMGIQWRVADAKAAGLHPLAAIGAGGASFSPSAQVMGGDSPSNFTGVSDAISAMGQNTKRAQVATQTPYEREMERLSLERAQLQNRLLEGQVQNEWAALMGQPPTPAMAADVGVSTRPVRLGQVSVAPVGMVSSKPSESISSAPNDYGLEAAGTPGFKSYGITPRLRVELPNQQLAESLEGMGVVGHVLGPALAGIRAADKVWSGSDKPSDALLPRGYRWEWSRLKQSWSAVKNR